MWGRRLGRWALLVALTAAWSSVGVGRAEAAGNDSFKWAEGIPSLPYSTQGDTTTATSDSIDPRSQCAVGTSAYGDVQTGTSSQNVWFRYTPPTSQLVHIRLDTIEAWWGVLAVYRLSPSGNVFRASPPTDWEAVVCDSELGNLDEVTFEAVAGEQYRIEVGGNTTGRSELDSSGTFALDVREVPAAPNDDIADATVLTGNPSSATGSGYGATAEVGEPASQCTTLATHTLWYRYTEPVGGDVVVDDAGTSYTAAVAVFTGASRPVAPVACTDADPSQPSTRVQFAAVAGTTYWIQLIGGLPAEGPVAAIAVSRP